MDATAPTPSLLSSSVSSAIRATISPNASVKRRPTDPPTNQPPPPPAHTGMVQSLLDLPDATLSEILRLLPTGRQLLNALEANRAMRAIAVSDPTVWQPLSSEAGWLVRRRADESFAAHFRRAVYADAYLISLGGDRGDMFPLVTQGIPSADMYDVRLQTWLTSPSPELETWRNAPCMAADDGWLYVIGGWDEHTDEALATIEAIPVATAASVAMAGPIPSVDNADEDAPDSSGAAGGWRTRLPDMPEPRCFAAATFDASGALWVAGGGDAMSRGACCLTSIIRLDIAHDGGGSGDGGELLSPAGTVAQWEAAGEMLEPRCGLALAADGRNSTLFCCGGYSGGICYQNTVESFDMSGVREPQLLPPMAAGRSGCGAGVGPDGALYVVGGSDDGSSMLASCERYDPREVCMRAACLACLACPQCPFREVLSPRGALSFRGPHGPRPTAHLPPQPLATAATACAHRPPQILTCLRPSPFLVGACPSPACAGLLARHPRPAHGARVPRRHVCTRRVSLRGRRVRRPERRIAAGDYARGLRSTSQQVAHRAAHAASAVQPRLCRRIRARGRVGATVT